MRRDAWDMMKSRKSYFYPFFEGLVWGGWVWGGGVFYEI
jgi:hypothetical protein